MNLIRKVNFMQQKYKGVALVATVAAMIAFLLLAYGIFTVQSSQFQMLISGHDAVNAQKLAEVDAELLKMINYDDVNNDAVLGELNLHLNRGDMQSVTVEGDWQDEIIIGDGSSSGGLRIATINIYKRGDTAPRYSMQVPILKSGQTYSKKAFDDFIDELKAKDAELDAKDRELESKDQQLKAKDKQLRATFQALQHGMVALSDQLNSARSSIINARNAATCRCTHN